MPQSFSAAIDKHLGVHADALRFRSQRSRVLASNLSNADTPNFKARDLDFREALRSQQGGGRLRVTHSNHIAVGSPGAGSELKYRNPFQPSMDGNTVETEVEQANFARNAIEYQASLMFLNGKIRGLRNALKAGSRG